MSRLVSAWHPTWKLGNCNAVLDSRVSGGVTKPRSPQLLHENDISTCGGLGKDTAKGDNPSCVVDVFCCCAVPDERVVSCRVVRRLNAKLGLPVLLGGARPHFKNSLGALKTSKQRHAHASSHSKNRLICICLHALQFAIPLVVQLASINCFTCK
jgi:hypothetical protein